MTLESYNGPQLDNVTVPPEDFEGLSKEECIDIVKEWFGENFEDPVHNDMYITAEGGYQYIWGGPYDAREIIWEAFEKVLPEETIEAVIEDLESDGTTNWTSAHRRVQPPEEDIDPAIPFNEMQRHISELEEAIANLQNRPAGIGHNRPPEPIEDAPITNIDIENITVNINILKSQEPYNVEDKEQVEQAVEELSTIRKKLGDYFAEKGKEFIDEAIKAAGAEFGKNAMRVGALYAASKILEKLVQAAVSWTNMIF
jgi:hypothetical protein